MKGLLTEPLDTIFGGRGTDIPNACFFYIKKGRREVFNFLSKM